MRIKRGNEHKSLPLVNLINVRYYHYYVHNGAHYHSKKREGPSAPQYKIDCMNSAIATRGQLLNCITVCTESSPGQVSMLSGFHCEIHKIHSGSRINVTETGMSLMAKIVSHFNGWSVVHTTFDAVCGRQNNCHPKMS